MKATRKGKKRRAAVVENEVSRWNRPDPVRKRCADLIEQMRVFLKSTEQVSMLEYARLMYIKHSTRPGIAEEYAAISSGITLMNFIEKYEGIDDIPLDVETLKRVERDGLDWKGKS
jgi:hypothetical protein